MFNVVWLKKDLRLHDHVALTTAIENNYPTVVIFILENEWLKQDDFSNRHWRFAYECLIDIGKRLNKTTKILYVLQGDVLAIFNELKLTHGDFNLFSHEETGNNFTYKRDKNIKSFCKKNNIVWREWPQFSVQRGLKNRMNWADEWNKFMSVSQKEVNLNNIIPFQLDPQFREKYKLTHHPKKEIDLQLGGENEALNLWSNFLAFRHKNYSKHISKPNESRESCSRLSPHLTWGSISIRKLIQDIQDIPKPSRALLNFKSRLHWHCHFIQKLESEPRIEFENQNYAYNQIRNQLNKDWLERWKSGQTGIPLVDACMRCVNQTGYLNFRMRAMLISYWTQHLWQPWQPAAIHLAKQFTDYEPGIHYSQVQMQAGTVGYHTIRVYNPIKQALEHDPEAKFIKKWVPELRNLPIDLAISPWKINEMEQLFYSFTLGLNYPKPLTDPEVSGKIASQELHIFQKQELTKREAKKIMSTHVVPKNKKGQS